MVTTGLPVIISIFQWLSEYAASHTHWFDSNHPNNHLIIQYCCNDSFDFSSLDDEGKSVIYDFTRWLSILVLSFDGGLETNNVRSFSVNDQQINISWVHGITYNVDLDGWNRSTRRSIDYIFERACSMSKLSTDMNQSKFQIFNYINFYKQQLDSIYKYSKNGISQHLDLIIRDDHLVFTILSAMPSKILQDFYLELSHLFSEGLAIPGLGTPVSIKQFFSKSYINEITLLDKVKLHYNLQLFSQLDPDLIQMISTKTSEFIRASYQDSKISSFVDEQIQQVSNQQLQPRLNLVSLVESQFFQGFL